MIEEHESSTLVRMMDQVNAWETVGDRRAIFLSCYALMTQNMLAALNDGRFRDPKWVKELLDHFAQYYFQGLSAFDQADGNVPRVWQQAHHVAIEHKGLALQNLMLGVNAHINYDLVLVVVDLLLPNWSNLPDSVRQDRFQDYCLMNDVIGEAIDSVQDQILEKYEPAMDLVDKLLGPMDEWITSRAISSWRGEVWKNAIRMVESRTSAEREDIRREIEESALNKANFFAQDLSAF